MPFHLPSPRPTVHITAVSLALLPVLSWGAAVVDLPAVPPAKRTVALEEVWSLGADADDVLLGLVASGVLDEDGNVLLADRQLAHVLVVSPQGEVIATLGREGEGPGELSNLQSVFIAGDRVGMVQSFPGKVVYVDRNGIPAGGFTLGGEEAGGFYSFRDLRCIGNALVGHTDRSRIDFDADEATTSATLSVMDFNGAFGTELVSHEVSRGIMNIVLDEAAEWAEFTTWAVGPGGTVATVAERGTWAIRVRSPDGEILRTLRRPFKPRMRSAAQAEEATSGIHLAIATGKSKIVSKALGTDPAIVDLQYASDGRLFVTTCHNAAGLLRQGVAGRFDVLAPAGEFLEELTVTFAGHDPQKDALVFLDGTHFLVLRNFEDAEKAITAALLHDEEQVDPSDAEPLEVVLVKMPQ